MDSTEHVRIMRIIDQINFIKIIFTILISFKYNIMELQCKLVSIS